jgi:hypothetical protein
MVLKRLREGVKKCQWEHLWKRNGEAVCAAGGGDPKLESMSAIYQEYKNCPTLGGQPKRKAVYPWTGGVECGFCGIEISSFWTRL